MSHRIQHRINELKDAIDSYSPGSTFRFARDRPTQPPSILRIGLFGPPGVGKSALINSMHYATGKMWESKAPEGLVDDSSGSMTLARKAVPLTEKITMVDNRGMRTLGGPFMVELGHQIAGVYNDGEPVEWDVGFLRRLVAGLERAYRAKADCEIYCAVLVISALDHCVRATDLQELIAQIRKMTGHPPIVVVTFRKHPNVREEVISAFRTGLQHQHIEYVFEVENYTQKDHMYDPEKHLVLLEALYQCAIIGDGVMKNKESNQGCVIL